MVRRNQRDPDRDREYFATNGGAIEVSENNLRVLVDEADLADDINESEAQKALERAEKMKAEAKDEVSLEHAQTLVDRQAVRLQVAGLKRRHQRK
jgi:F0F1-type ATP synthase epsilon subunit